jgi:hypothetical protein
MKNPKTHKPNGAHHDEIKNRSTSPEHDTPPRRTDVAPRPATPLEVRVSRALDQELEWYFAYAEAALHRESVGMLPSYAVVRILQAQRLLGNAVFAYARARALEGAALGVA